MNSDEHASSASNNSDSHPLDDVIKLDEDFFNQQFRDKKLYGLDTYDRYKAFVETHRRRYEQLIDELKKKEFEQLEVDLNSNLPEGISDLDLQSFLEADDDDEHLIDLLETSEEFTRLKTHYTEEAKKLQERLDNHTKRYRQILRECLKPTNDQTPASVGQNFLDAILKAYDANLPSLDELLPEATVEKVEESNYQIRLDNLIINGATPNETEALYGDFKASFTELLKSTTDDGELALAFRRRLKLLRNGYRHPIAPNETSIHKSTGNSFCEHRYVEGERYIRVLFSPDSCDIQAFSQSNPFPLAINSPAVVLIHELEHAISAQCDPFGIIARAHVPDFGFSTKEELRVIRGIELQTNCALGLPARVSHYGWRLSANGKDITSREPMLIVKSDGETRRVNKHEIQGRLVKLQTDGSTQKPTEVGIRTESGKLAAYDYGQIYTIMNMNPESHFPGKADYTASLQEAIMHGDAVTLRLEEDGYKRNKLPEFKNPAQVKRFNRFKEAYPTLAFPDSSVRQQATAAVGGRKNARAPKPALIVEALILDCFSDSTLEGGIVSPADVKQAFGTRVFQPKEGYLYIEEMDQATKEKRFYEISAFPFTDDPNKLTGKSAKLSFKISPRHQALLSGDTEKIEAGNALVVREMEAGRLNGTALKRILATPLNLYGQTRSEALLKHTEAILTALQNRWLAQADVSDLEPMLDWLERINVEPQKGSRKRKTPSAATRDEAGPSSTSADQLFAAYVKQFQKKVIADLARLRPDIAGTEAEMEAVFESGIPGAIPNGVSPLGRLAANLIKSLMMDDHDEALRQAQEMAPGSSPTENKKIFQPLKDYLTAQQPWREHMQRMYPGYLEKELKDPRHKRAATEKALKETAKEARNQYNSNDSARSNADSAAANENVEQSAIARLTDAFVKAKSILNQIGEKNYGLLLLDVADRRLPNSFSLEVAGSMANGAYCLQARQKDKTTFYCLRASANEFGDQTIFIGLSGDQLEKRFIKKPDVISTGDRFNASITRTKARAVCLLKPVSMNAQKKAERKGR
jgi:hypothetical protein